MTARAVFVPTPADAVAPSLGDFERMAGEAYAGLPEAFRLMSSDVVIRVADFAEEDVLVELGIDHPIELTGLYQGVDLTQRSTLDAVTEPDFVWLYRRPILDEWCERGNVTLMELIRHVLVHEIGHHFGLSDDDMEAIEAEA